MFCREQSARLGRRIREIEAAGAQLIAIGNGNAHWAKSFIEDEKVEFPVYVDPGRLTYEHFGMRRSLTRVFGPRSIRHGMRAMKGGHFQTQTRGDAFQNGGVIVLDAAGNIVYEHIEAEAGDLADLDEVIAALG